MAETIRLTGLPQQRDMAGVGRAVAARQGDYLAAMPAPDAELNGLLSGLSTLSPVLRQRQEQQFALDHQAQLDQAAADVGRVENPMDAITGAPREAPAGLSPALGQAYGRAFGQLITQRAAIQLRDATVADYAKLKDTVGFDPDAFLLERRKVGLGDIKDPQMAGVLGQAFNQVEEEIRADSRREMVAKHEQAKNTGLFQLVSQGVRADMNPAAIGSWYRSTMLPHMKDLQVDPKQGAAMLLSQLMATSDKAGGMPELFDAFDEDSDVPGQTILAVNPQLQAHVTQAKNAARAQREKAVHAATEPHRAGLYMTLDAMVMKAPEKVTPELVIGMISPNGLTAKEAASYVHGAMVARQKAAGASGIDEAAAKGALWYYDAKDQKAYMDRVLGPSLLEMRDAAMGGNQQKVEQLMQGLMHRQSQLGSTESLDVLQRFTELSVSALPSDAGPSANFKAAASIYKAMSSDPQYRDRYFKGPAAEVMEAYTSAQNADGDELTAYKAAYRGQDPAVKKAAAAMAASPEFQKKLSATAARYATGSTMSPAWMPWGQRPQNEGQMGVWAGTAARELLNRRPDLIGNDDAINSYIKTEAAKNWVIDENSSIAVKVPPAFGGQQTQQAITSYSADLRKSLGTDRLPEDAAIQFVANGTEGALSVTATVGGVTRVLSSTSVQALLQREKNKLMTQEERAQVGDYLVALRTGQPLPALSDTAMGKARTSGFLSEKDQRSITEAFNKQFMEKLNMVPKMSFGKPTGDRTAFPVGPGKVDHALTSQVSLELAGSTVFAQGTEHQGLAASLITMREGVVLRAYDDPAKGAGKNIGMGYNLNANADTVNADLKRAGVPEQLIEAIKEGKADLSKDQATRLLQVSMVRYEKQVKATAEATSPGLWAKMPPAQKAVMVDIAWQTGNPAQFKKAWAALAAGDAASFATETKVFYTNQKGVKTEDTRAADLRASMLEGIAHWNARVSVAGSRPSTALQSAALAIP